MNDAIGILIVISPFAAIFGWTCYCLYGAFFRPKPVIRYVPYVEPERPAQRPTRAPQRYEEEDHQAEGFWQYQRQGEPETRTFWANLRYKGREWEIPRIPIKVAISLVGYEILDTQAAFTGYEGLVDQVGFWDEPEDGALRFWLERREPVELHPETTLLLASGMG